MADDQKGGGQQLIMKEAAGSGAPSPSIDPDRFKKRLKILYSHWNKRKVDLWRSVHAIAIPHPHETTVYLKSGALNLWLLGYEFVDTVMVFMEKEIHILCSPKKASVLRAVQASAKEAVGADIVLHVKAKADNEAVIMDALLTDISKGSGVSIPIVGYVAREASRGQIAEKWTEKLKSAKFQLRDVIGGFSDLFAVKDDSEVMNVRKAAYWTGTVMKHRVRPKIEDVIDEERKVTHSWLTEETEKAMLDASGVSARLNQDNIDVCFGPIFQSGGEFDLRLSAASNGDFLYYDSASVIICALGSSYNRYCSVIARTLLFDANPLQSKAYAVLLEAQEAVIGSLRPGIKLRAVYQAAVSVVERDAPELVPHLTKSAGSSMGLEFLELGWVINAKNERAVRQNMVFNVYLGIQNLQNDPENPKSRTFSLLLADTIIVGKEETTVATRRCSKLAKDISYSFAEEGEGEEEEVKRVAFDREETEVTTLGSSIHRSSEEQGMQQWLEPLPKEAKAPRTRRRVLSKRQLWLEPLPKEAKAPRTKRIVVEIIKASDSPADTT